MPECRSRPRAGVWFLAAAFALLVPAATAHAMVWGVCGHPTWPDYADWVPGNMAKQIALVRELGCTFYRCSFEGASYPQILDIVVPPAQSAGVTILPILPLKIHPGESTDANEQDNYANARRWADYAIAKGYRLPYWELGNELENGGYVSVKGDGSSPDDFPDKKPGATAAIAAALKGSYHGLKDAYAQARQAGKTDLVPQVLYGCTYRHWGLLAKIAALNHEMPCDILSWHWYTPAYGDFTAAIKNPLSSNFLRSPAESLAQFKRNDDPARAMDVWITETNRSVKPTATSYLNGSYSNNTTHQDWPAEAQVITSTLADLKKADNVKAIFVYELLDEPTAHGKTAAAQSGEGYLGLMTGLDGTRKDAFRAYQEATRASP